MALRRASEEGPEGQALFITALAGGGRQSQGCMFFLEWERGVFLASKPRSGDRQGEKYHLENVWPRLGV